MHVRESVWLRDAEGIHETSAISPAAWHGERGCVVGPFSSAQIARIFLQYRRCASRTARVFPARSAYYVEMCA
ncbi:MAG TPA: hypothetical protein VKB31_09760 [Trueperaceae bacterium]|nr:hypothetical protein [Trueperaceae bacterium]